MYQLFYKQNCKNNLTTLENIYLSAFIILANSKFDYIEPFKQTCGGFAPPPQVFNWCKKNTQVQSHWPAYNRHNILIIHVLAHYTRA